MGGGAESGKEWYYATITHDAFDLNVQGPPCPGPLLLVTSGGLDWTPV